MSEQCKFDNWSVTVDVYEDREEVNVEFEFIGKEEEDEREDEREEGREEVIAEGEEFIRIVQEVCGWKCDREE